VTRTLLAFVTWLCIMRFMKVAGTVLPYRWTLLLCILTGLYAATVMTYIFIETPNATGARDFHQFWYAGQFIIQGRDPYAAFFAGEQPALPIAYLDGVILDRYPVGQPELEITPSNTPTMLLLLTPLAFFSWTTAKFIFMFINIVLMLIPAILIVRAIPFAGVQLSRLDELLIFLVYIDLSATRIAIENGQTTLLVFLLMLIALLYAQRDWRVSGLALGLALSKYSLSLPVFLFLLFKKKFNILILAVAIQLLGILGMAWITGTSPVTIVQENIQLFFRLFDQPGIQLSRWFEDLSNNLIVSMLPMLLMTLAVFIPILYWMRTRPASADQEDVIDFHLLTVLFIWTMLVAYHRLYDTLILIAFVVLLYKGLSIPALWSLSGNERRILLGYLGLLPLILILPARLVDRFLPGFYGADGDLIVTIFLLLMLGISMFLLERATRTRAFTPGLDSGMDG
jgi:hypothetical protein